MTRRTAVALYSPGRAEASSVTAVIFRRSVFQIIPSTPAVFAPLVLVTCFTASSRALILFTRISCSFRAFANCPAAHAVPIRSCRAWTSVVIFAQLIVFQFRFMFCVCCPLGTVNFPVVGSVLPELTHIFKQLFTF
jgi:hypothetical protein